MKILFTINHPYKKKPPLSRKGKYQRQQKKHRSGRYCAPVCNIQTGTNLFNPMYERIPSQLKSELQLEDIDSWEVYLQQIRKDRTDTDVCIVSETDLKTNIPNSAVDIHNYDIYRRDRNWSGMDKRAKGGIAIYVRKNLDIVDVYRSSLYELIYLVVRLPSGHMLVVCGFYHPPRPTYQVKDLMIYLVDLMDNILDKFPGGVIVAGGDVNRLDPDELCSMTGWKALVSFPTRDDSILDNVFTNRSDLFGKCKPYNITTKTDHTAVILPPGTKLKPIRRKFQIRDCRKHRKECLYKSLAGENWGAVLNTTDVDQAVSNLETVIHAHMDKCMPLKTVSISSRDPEWITPFLKSLLRIKSRISPNNLERNIEINKRISEIIVQNRKKTVSRTY